MVACAARSFDSAQIFATKHSINQPYGSYEELLKDENVDIVYVGNIHAFRRSIGEQCLMANKHTLLEKPFTCNADDAEYLIQLARDRHLFLMEGMWTRFFPAVEQARQLVMGDTNSIGDVVTVISDFNFNASDSEAYPSSFVYNHKLGGGASLLVAPYPLAASTLFFGGRLPDIIKAVGQVDQATGVDLQASMSLRFAPTSTSNLPPATMEESNIHERKTPKLPGAGMATCTVGMLCESAEETIVVGTKGRLTIHTPGHCPTKVSVSIKAQGDRGQATQFMEFEYLLPADTPEIEAAGGYYYPNSAGFAYEAAAVARCIAAGKLEAPQYTLEETLVNMKLIDELRHQLGVKPIGGIISETVE